MTTRTFKQLGQGYGSLPTTIIAKIDGVEVFSGEVTTVNQPFPTVSELSLTIDNILFSWTKSTDFSGTLTMEISVQGSPLLLTTTLADYPIDSPDKQGVFTSFYSIEKDGTIYFDPFDHETIDGVSVSRIDSPELSGQWWWGIMPGSTFTATVNVEASQAPPPPPTPTI